MKILIFMLAGLLIVSNIFSFPLSGGNKTIIQDVKATGGRPGRVSSQYYMENDVIGQAALIGYAFSGSKGLAHGYLGGGLAGIGVDYIQSTILYPGNNTFIDVLNLIKGRVESPILIREEQILIQRLSDNKYFDGTGWVDTEVWITCDGTDNWSYAINNRKIFDYGVSYKVSAKGIDVTGAEEKLYPTVTFTFVFSTDFKTYIAAYPNPFFPDSPDSSKASITIEYFLPEYNHTDIYIYAVNGELVKKWSGEEYNTPGLHRIKWDGRNENNVIVGNGVYMLVVTSGDEKGIDKIVVVR